jgi:hypothetical protein
VSSCMRRASSRMCHSVCRVSPACAPSGRGATGRSGKSGNIASFWEEQHIFYAMLNPEQRTWGNETKFGSLAELALVTANQPTTCAWPKLVHRR